MLLSLVLLRRKFGCWLVLEIAMVNLGLCWIGLDLCFRISTIMLEVELKRYVEVFGRIET